jgi:sodium-dependent dicarboxylate transporter 2/3/5
MTSAQWRMAVIFLITALLWIFREPVEGFGWAPLLGAEDWVNDGTSAILMAVVCFVVPSGSKAQTPLLQWKATERVPWGILLLFGGGLALANGMSAAGLDAYLANQLGSVIATLPDWGKSATTVFGMIWLTELTSNLASVQMFTPVLAETAKSLGTPPLLLMVPATLAASCAFMLPVATAPNAIVYGTGRVKISEMVKAGVCLNLLGVVWIVAAVWLLGSFAFGKAAMFAGG